jgi:predicted Zn finger-like uncharacterized protein
MNHITRCPACKTTFRVSSEQLAARGGRVRCGKCSAVFDGGTHLLMDEDVEAPSDHAAEPDYPVDVGEPVERAADDLPETGEPPSPESVETLSDSPASTSVDETVPVNSMSAPHEVEAEKPRTRSKLVVPAFLARQHSPVARTLAWAVLSVTAVAGLAVQAALHFRTELAVLLPTSRAYLESACGALGCELRLPRRADLMSIESSDLQADSQRTGVIVLNALLRNRAPFAQEYPDLELTLTDQGDRPVIRKVLAAADYLQDKRAAVPSGLAGGAEETVRVYLDTGGIAATGYQLFLFYTCPAQASSAFWQLSYPSRCQDSRNK